MEALNLKHIDKNYGLTLRDVAYKIVKDYDLSKDVMQDSLVKIWKNQNKFDESKATLFTWMRNIVVRTAIDATRSIKTKQPFLTSPEASVFCKNSSQINTDVIDLHGHINKLEFKYAFIIRQIYIHGFSEEQVSENYRIPLGTVKSRKKIGLRELKKIYKS